MARPEGVHFKQRNHFPERQTDTRVAGLVRQERGARHGTERRRGHRTTTAGGRAWPRALRATSVGLPISAPSLLPQGLCTGWRLARDIHFYLPVLNHPGQS